MKIFRVFLLFALLEVPASALKNPPIPATPLPAPDICEMVKVQTPNLLGEVDVTENLEICHDKLFRVAVSKNCVKDNCQLIQTASYKGTHPVYSQRGTPGSWLCRAVGGKSSMTFMSTFNAGNNLERTTVPVGAKLHICKKDGGLASDDYLVGKMAAQK